jgi:hypothetical protein
LIVVLFDLVRDSIRLMGEEELVRVGFDGGLVLMGL